MEITAHPLQEQAIDLLKSLYFEKNLALTKAMRTVIDGYYPSIESIFGTLNFHKNEDLVSDFIKSNSALIKQTEDELKSKKEEPVESSNEAANFDSAFEDIFADRKPVDVYSSIKAVPIADIEEALSNAVGKVCSEELDFKIESISKSNVTFSTDVVIQATISAKSLFR